RDNLSLISYAVDNADDPAIYRSNKDQKNKVLRDDEGTSFHIRYKNGEKAAADLTALLQQIENTLHVLPHDRWLEFAAQFEYDGERDCLEARVGGALRWAAEVLSSSIPTLDYIVHAGVKLR